MICAMVTKNRQQTGRSASSIPESPVQDVPPGAAFQPDETTATLRAVRAMTKAIGDLDQVLGKLVVEALPAALAQAFRGLPSDQRACARCAVRQARFSRLHGEQMVFAMRRAAEANGISADDPAAANLDLTDFLPEELRPDPANPVDDNRVPTVYPEYTAVGGTPLCLYDARAYELETAAQQQTAGRPGLLAAPAGMSATVAARLASQGR
jgi:hypothetical protein